MFYHVEWYRKPLLRDEGGAFCVGKRVGAVAPYQYKVGAKLFFSETVFGGFYSLLWLFDGERQNVHLMLLPFQGVTTPTRVNPGCRFACPGLVAPLGFQPVLVNTSQLYHRKQRGCAL